MGLDICFCEKKILVSLCQMGDNMEAFTIYLKAKNTCITGSKVLKNNLLLL